MVVRDRWFQVTLLLFYIVGLVYMLGNLIACVDFLFAFLSVSLTDISGLMRGIKPHLQRPLYSVHLHSAQAQQLGFQKRGHYFVSKCIPKVYNHFSRHLSLDGELLKSSI